MPRTLLACGAALLTLGIGTTAVQATAISLNRSTLPANTTLPQCMDIGRAALQRAGMTPLNDTSEAVWGEIRPDVVAAFYCLIDRNVAVISVGGPNTDATQSALDQIMNALRK